MRIGLMLTEPGPGPDPIAELVEYVAQAKAAGFDSIFMPQVLGLDALTAIAVAGSRVDGIELATGVVPIYTRHPLALAQQALTTQAAMDGRLTLGIGLSHKVIVENMFGLPFDKPARFMDEYLSVLLPLLDERKVSFDGEKVRTHLGITTPCPHPVPVMLAALAPRMLRLAGARTQGTILWMTGPATVRDHVLPVITAAADAAGLPAPRIVCGLPVCVTDDVPDAREQANAEFAIYGQLPSYKAMLDREGASSPADVAIVGTASEVTDRISSLADVGVTDFIVAELGTSDDKQRTREALRTLTAASVGA